MIVEEVEYEEFVEFVDLVWNWFVEVVDIK